MKSVSVLLFYVTVTTGYNTDDFVGEVMTAMETCNSYMHAALDCWPPKRKINKPRVMKTNYRFFFVTGF